MSPDGAGNPEHAVLQVDDLHFGFAQRPLFSGFSARVPAGVTLLRGGESTGKTTLLRLFAGELPASQGQLEIHGIGLAGQAQAYRHQVFRTDPRSEALDAISAADWFKALGQTCPGFQHDAVAPLAEALALTPHLAKPLYMLSAGSRRKVWLAAAFASGAALTLLDEPFAALDLASVRVVLGLLREAAQAAPISGRAWVVADYTAPADVPLASVIDLGE